MKQPTRPGHLATAELNLKTSASGRKKMGDSNRTRLFYANWKTTELNWVAPVEPKPKLWKKPT